MKNEDGELPIEYKFFCFNGAPKYVLVISGRFLQKNVTMDTYTMDWTHTDLINGGALAGDVFDKPQNFDEMYEISKRLSEKFPVLRVDFNIWNGSAYIGELTLYDSGGFENYEPVEWDLKLGKELKLPAKYRR